MEGEQRQDIEAAISRMNVTRGGRRELRNLNEHVSPDEEVLEITTGRYADGFGLIVLSDQRLLFFKDGWVFTNSTDFPLEKVSSVEFSTGLLSGTITVYASGSPAQIDQVEKNDGKRIVDNMRGRLSAGGGPETPNGAPTSQALEPTEQLKRLGELRESGVLTAEEFEEKKKKLLDSI